jgi:MFS family permease
LPELIDSRDSWLITVAALVAASVSLGAPYVVIVALRPIAEELGGFRSVPSGAMSLAMLGTGVGGLAMGWMAERVGVRAVVMFGAVMVCAGLTLSSRGEVWQLYVGHGLLIGLIGNGAVNAPLCVYVTRWFERRRGAALALIASGQYVAGACWPPLFERAIATYGWRQTMVTFGFVVVGVVVPLAAMFLRPPPEVPESAVAAGTVGVKARVLELPPNAVFALLAGASFLCCIPMAMPSAHVIALCGDLGMTPAKGAAMLTVILVCAFIARQLWGWLSTVSAER